MQFDGLTMRACLAALEQVAVGGRLQRIVQLTPLSLLLEIYAGRALDLVVSAETDAACLFLAGSKLEASLEPTPFCSLLRRNLTGSRLVAASQEGWDRIASLVFIGRDELGDQLRWTLVLETMGKHSNLICVRPDGRILDAAKRIGRARSRARQVLPGIPYHAPPGQDKLKPDLITANDLLTAVSQDGSLPAGRELARLLTGHVSGLGPARALTIAGAVPATHEAGARVEDTAAALAAAVRSEADSATRAGPAAGLVMAGVEASFRRFFTGGAPVEGGSPKAKPSAATEQAALLRVVEAASQRARRRLNAAEEQLAAMASAEAAREQADLIFTHLMDLRERWAEAVAAGLAGFSAELPAEPGESDAIEPGHKPTVTVALPATVDPSVTATQLYERYAQLKRTQATLVELVSEHRQQTEHLASLAYQLTQDLGPSELTEIRTEAEAAGIKAPHAHGRGHGRADDQRRSRTARVSDASRPRHFASPSGREIIVGRNNKQNDALLRLGQPGDIWLHARGVPGAHVLLRHDGPPGTDAPPPAAEVECAAGIAAHFSQARGASTVAVDWCPLAQVRKIKGAPPGMVTYTGERTVHVAPALPAQEPT